MHFLTSALFFFVIILNYTTSNKNYDYKDAQCIILFFCFYCEHGCHVYIQTAIKLKQPRRTSKATKKNVEKILSAVVKNTMRYFIEIRDEN